MDTILWLTVGLAAFDLMLLVMCYFAFRNHAPLDQKALIMTGGGLAGFVIQAVMFYSGAFLILQLATIAGIFGICAWAPGRRLARK
jgi:hypothetical protein